MPTVISNPSAHFDPILYLLLHIVLFRCYLKEDEYLLLAECLCFWLLFINNERHGVSEVVESPMFLILCSLFLMSLDVEPELVGVPLLGQSEECGCLVFVEVTFELEYNCVSHDEAEQLVDLLLRPLELSIFIFQ